MSLGNLNNPANKGSNFNWQKRMLELAASCCAPTLTQEEMDAWTTANPGRMVFNSDTSTMWYWNGSSWLELASV